MTSPLCHKLNDIPDMELISKIALKGVIGQALQEALEDLTKEEKEDQNNNNNNDDDPDYVAPSSVSILLRDIHHHAILESFGRAVAQTKWHTTTTTPSINNLSSQLPTPPCAIISGRLDHYNRFQGQWRIVIDEGATLRPKPILQQQKSGKGGGATTTTMSDRRHNVSRFTAHIKEQEQQKRIIRNVSLNTETEHVVEHAVHDNHHDHFNDNNHGNNNNNNHDDGTENNTNDTTSTTCTEDDPVVIFEKLQILVYNDL